MFEVLDNISKVLTYYAPHNLLNTMINGGAKTPIYHEGSFMEQTGYHPQLSLNQMEKGISFSVLKVQGTYLGQLDQRDKGEFTIYNNTDHPKRILIEFYQDLCRVEEISATQRRCRYSGEHPQFAAPRIVTIGPGGAERVEFWYSTPPAPRKNAEYGDVMWIQVVIQMTDEQGKMAWLTARSKALSKK